MNILFLSSWFPYPPDNGARQRAYHLLRYLALKNRVSLFALTDPDFVPANAEPIRGLVTDLQTYPRPRYYARRARALAAFLSSHPRYLVDSYDPALMDLVRRAAARESFDVIVALQLTMAYYASNLEHPKKVFDEVEAGVFADGTSGVYGIRRWRYRMTWWKMSRYLKTLASHFENLTVVSQREAQILREQQIPPERVHVIPNGVDCDDMPRPPTMFDPYSLIYTGALTYDANLDAMRYFVHEILPLVRAQEPRVQLRITGRAEQVAINEISVDNAVSFTGYVEDVRPYIQESAICIVPLRIGGGTRLKILEAMKLGTPVVSTSKGAEGLEIRDNEHLLIADSPDLFAEAIIRLLHDRSLRRQLAETARQRICELYDWQGIGEKLNQVLYETVHG